jgi:hypothetical protein
MNAAGETLKKSPSRLACPLLLARLPDRILDTLVRELFDQVPEKIQKRHLFGGKVLVSSFQ